MNTRAALLGSFTLSLLLTGCPLTDHYQLMTEEAGGSTAGTDEAGAHSGGAGGSGAGAGGASASGGADTMSAAGEAGERAVGGGPSGGADPAGGAGASSGGAGASSGGAGASSGGAGASSGGADQSGGGGALETGGGGASGNAGAGGGTCALACMPMSTCCAPTCVNLATSPQNCGACGNACNAGRMCAMSVCKGGWVSMAAPPMSFVSRSRAAVVAMGKSVFFWGGQDGNGNALDTGAIYIPSKNTWTYLPKDLSGPTARMMASAVWTGSVVIVFGGTDANGNPFRDGAIYDPTANQWTLLPLNNNVSRRSAPYSFWDGTRALFWGGLSASFAGVPNADRFDLTNWSISTSNGDPGAVLSPALAFDGATMYMSAGQLNGTRQDKAYSYTSSTDTWTKLTSSGLSPRSSAFGVWDGSRFIVWGGRDDGNGLRSDGSYLSGTKWTALSNFGAPSARMLAFRRSGWSFQINPGVVAIIGGQVSLSASATLTTTGAYYNVGTSVWTAIPTWPSGEAHEYGMGAWTGDEFVLWGGRDNNGVTSTGDRWAP